MQLVQDYRIREVHGTHFSNAPFRFLLETVTDGFPKDAGELVFDKETCERHGISPSLDLVNRKLRCTLRPRVLKRNTGGRKGDEWSFPDRQDVQSDDILISQIRRDEKWTPEYNVGAPHDALRQEIHYHLYAYSDDGTDGIHPSPTNCPLYNLTVELTEDQFRECTQFAPGTVLNVSFALLPPEPKPATEEEKQ
ncbi:MAG: hypothetical protein G01um101438_256 [Parcubacteria group bacterium Gr01-1014_38]|nr:MAG: hypothetical protein G01um101438_256 [Parcubacteria group bacterium Gr01-1014_38]